MAISVVVSPSKVPALRQLKQELGVSSYADVINYSLSALQWVQKHKRAGLTIAAVDEANHRYIEMRLPVPSVAA